MLIIFIGEFNNSILSSKYRDLQRIGRVFFQFYEGMVK